MSRRTFWTAVTAAIGTLLIAAGGASATPATVVQPSSPQGWTTANPPADNRPVSQVNFVSDGTAPGGGALQLITDATNASKASYMHPLATPLPLSAVTELGYQTKQNPSSFAGADATFQLQVELDGTPSTFLTLVYEPYWQNGGLGDPAPVIPGVWQSWNILSGGLLWASGTKSGPGAGCSTVNGAGGPPFYTLASLASHCTSAVVVAFGVSVGTYNPSYNVEADLVDFNGTVYDFQPETQCTTVCYVNATTGSDSYGGGTPSSAKQTIQAAVNQVSPGGTVIVAPGTYAENVNIPAADSGVTLQGAEAGTPVAGRTFGGPAESTVNGMITDQASGVTIDGFSETNPTVGFSATGIDVKSTGNGAVIENNMISGVTTSTGNAQGIYLEHGPDDVVIDGNLITNIHSYGSTKGILIGDSLSTDASSGVLIENNTISSVTSDAKGAYGVLNNNKIGAPSLTIEGNSFSTLTGGGWVHAIGLEADTPNLLVDHNTFASLSAPGIDSVAVWFENEDTSYGTATVTRNSLAVGAARLGIAVDPTLSGGTVNGSCNWWGDASGPSGVGSGSGSPVSGQVGYQPWLTSSNLDGSCNGFSPLPGGKATCIGWLPDGTYTDVTVPDGATCMLDAGDNITHDLKVGKGSTLIDNGAPIGHDLQANNSASVLINGGSIGHDVQVQNATGAVTVEGVSIGHDLQVQNNTGGVTVDGNTVAHDLQVQNNAAPTDVSTNTVGHDATCQHNGGQTGHGNSAAHNNSCPIGG